MTDPTTLHRAVLRQYLEGIADLAGHAGARGLKKGETETVLRHANAARAALKSLEIAAGWRGIGAALADDDDATHYSVGPHAHGMGAVEIEDA